jgi:glc operon protein GlcG
MDLPMRPVLSIEVAKAIAESAKSYAAGKGFDALIVLVLDAGGHLLYLERRDGVPPGPIQVAYLKARSATMFEVPSKVFEETVAGGLTGLIGLPGMAAFEGAVPIFHEGTLVGAIGVSGLTKELDGEIAQAGADALPEILARLGS